MKFFKIFTRLCIIIVLLFVLAAEVGADGPDNEAGAPSGPPPITDNSDPVQAVHRVVNLDKAVIVQSGPGGQGDDLDLSPGTSPDMIGGPAASGGSQIKSRAPVEYNKETGEINHAPDNGSPTNGFGPQNPTVDQGIGTSATTIIKFEGFDFFPNTWTLADQGAGGGGSGHLWDDVHTFQGSNCPPLSGTGSGWPADEGLNGLDPCNDISPDNYASDMDTWMIFGPFDLSDAKSAYVDFFFRIESEPNDDFLFWGASINGANFFGPPPMSGNLADGPHGNGYNFARLNLANVPGLGDLTGQSSVSIAFNFVSDGDANTDRGPFLDDITVRKNTDESVTLTDEPFNNTGFPNPNWEPTDITGNPTAYLWDDVHDFQGPNCPPHTTTGSMWPADIVINGVDLDPCGVSPDNYANNMDSWLIHGPFSLEGASEAWVDIYWRSKSEANFDHFFWGVSKDGNFFNGWVVSGDWTGGAYNNGYHLDFIDFSGVPFSGEDYRGEPEVWVGFNFTSDFIVGDQGPFVDDVLVVAEKSIVSTVFLPLAMKPPPPPQTTLKVHNTTTGNMTFTVRNAKLNGQPIGDLNCGTITPDQNKVCGQIDTGEYSAIADTTACNPLQKQILINQTPVHQVTVKCIS